MLTYIYLRMGAAGMLLKFVQNAIYIQIWNLLAQKAPLLKKIKPSND